MAKQRKPLTPKERKFIKGVVAGKTKRQAALEAYDVKTPETASVMASETLKRPNVQEALEAAYAEHGLSISKLIKPIADGLEASKDVYKNNNETKQVELVGSEPDHPTRLRAASMGLGLMIPKNDSSVNINFNSYTSDQKQVYDI